MRIVAWTVLMVWAAGVCAQTAAPGPPPMPADGKPADGKSKPVSKPRSAILLSPSDRQAIDEREMKAVKPASVEEALQPKPPGDPDNAKVERVDDLSNTTRIEQFRTSNRVSEVVVTPPRANFSYSMTNREGRQPFGTTQMTPGLSVPNFFRFEFGRPVPNPISPPPAEPAKPAN